MVFTLKFPPVCHFKANNKKFELNLTAFVKGVFFFFYKTLYCLSAVKFRFRSDYYQIYVNVFLDSYYTKVIGSFLNL